MYIGGGRRGSSLVLTGIIKMSSIREVEETFKKEAVINM